MKRALTIPIMALVTVGCFVAAVAIGPVSIPADQTAIIIFKALFGLDTSELKDSLVVTQIRLPRAIVAMLVGAALAVSGAVMQAVFRNPLADPGIIGVSSGAATAAVLSIVTGFAATWTWGLSASAFVGALLTVLLVQVVAATRGGGPATLVLVGVAFSAFLSAITSAAISNAPTDSEIRGITFWLNGDLVARDFSHVKIALVPIIVGLCIVMFMGRDLNIMLMGDTAARSTGVNLRLIRAILLTVSALLTATAVSVSGVIGFVGLVVPHLVRLVIGPDHRLLIPTAALTGASFLLVADTIARMLFSPVVLQTGTVVAFIGSPVFLWLLLRTRETKRFAS
ncbi:FecCD family ABC transporter permease [Corynebacterium sp. S7]